MKEIRCEICGKKYSPSFYVIGEFEFCSRECVNKFLEQEKLKKELKNNLRKKVKYNAKAKIRRNTIKKPKSKK